MPPNPVYSVPPPLPRTGQGRINFPQPAQMVASQSPNAPLLGGVNPTNPTSSYLPNIFSAFSRDGNPEGFLPNVRRNSSQNGEFGRLSEDDYEVILKKK